MKFISLNKYLKIKEEQKKFYSLEESFELLCNKIYEYHQKKISKLKTKVEKKQYLSKITELEFKIYAICSIGGAIDFKLVLHSDFPYVWNTFKNLL